jgi:hypothetical protein
LPGSTANTRAKQEYDENKHNEQGHKMTENEARIGTRVRTLVGFAGVPSGTEGVIDEDYGSGVTVAWDLPGSPLPRGYRVYDGRPAVASGLLRDGFDKQKELHFLGLV